MAGITHLMELVERILAHVDDGSSVTGFREPITRGSARGFVSIEPDPHDMAERLLVVRLGIMPLPTNDLERFLGHLLELNHGLRGRAAFSVDPDGQVTLTAGRPVDELDAGEVLDLVLWTSQQADDHDDRLLAEYG